MLSDVVLQFCSGSCLIFNVCKGFTACVWAILLTQLHWLYLRYWLRLCLSVLFSLWVFIFRVDPRVSAPSEQAPGSQQTCSVTVSSVFDEPWNWTQKCQHYNGCISPHEREDFSTSLVLECGLLDFSKPHYLFAQFSQIPTRILNKSSITATYWNVCSFDIFLHRYKSFQPIDISLTTFFAEHKEEFSSIVLDIGVDVCHETD